MFKIQLQYVFYKRRCDSDELIIIFFSDTDISITMTTAPIDSKGQEKKTKSWGDLQIPMVVVVNF